jgi:hypothetical protein
MSIHDLDDDSLLHVFYLFRPNLCNMTETGGNLWNFLDQDWWYKLAQVCRRWRHLILGSASYLRLSLLCIAGTPVAEVLAHSPPFPLIIVYDESFQHLSAEDEEGIIFALSHRNRVRCIFLLLDVPRLSRLISAIDDEFPALILLRLGTPTRHDTRMALPPKFEAPHLRYLFFTHIASPMGHSFLSSAIGLVILSLRWIHPSTYPHPNDFLQHLSLLPQLDTIKISFRAAVPDREIKRQPLHTPVITHVTHRNLRLFDFVGVSGFLEAILPHMAAPLLETLGLQFFNQLSFSVPHLQSFMMTTEKLRFSRVKFVFHHEAVVMFTYAHLKANSGLNNFYLEVPCKFLDWQVSSVTQISKDLSQLFSEVVDLTLDYREHTSLSEWHHQADRTQWLELLRSFRNVKILRVHNGLVGELSRCLQSDGGPSPSLEVLPELKELVCPEGCANDKTFAPFIHEREVAGQQISLIGKASPIIQSPFTLYSSSGVTHIEPDPDPLPQPNLPDARVARSRHATKPGIWSRSLPYYNLHPPPFVHRACPPNFIAIEVLPS